MIAQAPRKYPRTARFLGAAAALFAILGFAAPGLLVLAAWFALIAFILARGVDEKGSRALVGASLKHSLNPNRSMASYLIAERE